MCEGFNCKTFIDIKVVMSSELINMLTAKYLKNVKRIPSRLLAIFNKINCFPHQ